MRYLAGFRCKLLAIFDYFFFILRWDSWYFDSIEDDNQILPAQVYPPNLLMRPHLPPPIFGPYKNQQSVPKDIVRTTDLKAVAKLIRWKTLFKQ